MSASVADCVGLLDRFQIEGILESCAVERSGHIHDTFIAVFQGPSSRRRYVVQRLNPRVFADPLAVMGNLRAVTRHLRARLAAAGVQDAGRRALSLVPTREGRDFTLAEDGAVWRAFPFLEECHTLSAVSHPRQAHEAGRAFGAFQASFLHYDGPPLADVLPGFHDTPARFQAFLAAIAAADPERRALCGPEIEALRRREALAGALAERQASGLLPQRIVHNDAKVANLLFDDASGEALCVIDLDTVMPGLAAHDFGDLVRSAACSVGEDETDLDRVDLDSRGFAALAEGYLETAGAFLCAAEKDALVLAAKVIVCEQALRFLTDALEGDRYYRIARPGHNLDRARAQICLLERLERREPELLRCVERLAARHAA